MSGPQYSGTATRIGEKLALGVARFTGPDSQVLWRFHVSRLIGRDHLIEEDATPELFREMKKFAEKALELLETDGGRK